MNAKEAVEALRAVHVESSYWRNDPTLSTQGRRESCCSVCARDQGWPCATKRILDEVTE